MLLVVIKGAPTGDHQLAVIVFLAELIFVCLFVCQQETENANGDEQRSTNW